MKTSRPLLTIFIFFLVTLLVSGASAPNPHSRWFIETVDAPMHFDNLTSSMLKIIDDKPTMAFGGDHLYLRYWNYDTLDWTIETIDPSPGVGSYASLAKDAFGRTFISYYDSVNQTLKFATPSDNIFIPGWDVETIDATPDSGKGSAIAVLAGGQPHISYTAHIGTTFYLKYARRSCTGSFPHIVCSWPTQEQVAAAIFDGAGTSIAIASDGTPHISYVDAYFNLKHAYRLGDGSGNCGDGNNWQCETVPGQTGTISMATSLALYNDYPRIAFHDNTAGLSFAYQDAGGWHLSLLRAGLDLTDEDLSLTVDPGGLPHISYIVSSDHHVMHAFGSSPSGGSWTNENITAATFSGQTAIAYNTSPSAYPCILYYQTTNGYLEYTCKSAGWDEPSIVADSGNVGLSSSLALGRDGKPHIAYMDYLSMPAYPILANWSAAAEGCNNPSTAVPWDCVQLDDSTTGWGSGYLPSAAVNPVNGNPAVSYMAYTDTTSGLGYSWYVGTGGNCPGNTAWNCTTIESITGLLGYSSSLAFQSTGKPVIAYKTSDMKLKVATYMGSPTPGSCSGDANWECEVIDTGLGSTSSRPSLALKSDDVPVISYLDSANHQLKLASVVFSGGTGCTGGSYPGSWTCSVIVASPGYDELDSSLELVSDTQAVISYSPGALKMATVSLPGGTSTIVVIDGANAGASNSLALFQGIPWIAYIDSDVPHSLRMAHQVGVGNGNCGDDDAWQCELLDDAGSVGQDPSLAINSAGTAYISYYDESNKDLKLAYTRLFGFMPLLMKP
jgi:hypothetical protein